MAEAIGALGQNTETEDPPAPVPQSWAGYSWYMLKKIGTRTYGGSCTGCVAYTMI